MLKSFYPFEYAESVFSVDYEKLFSLGFRALIFDIDNTLVHHGDDSNEEIDNFFKHIHSIGFKTLLLSNNNRSRILRFIKNIDTLYIEEAEKPKKGGYLKALSMLDVKREQAIVIGDQLFTDVFGANRARIPSILVKFIRLPNETDFGKRRRAEAIVLDRYLKSKHTHRLGDIIKSEE